MAPMDIGETWNESTTRRDELTGRTVRALTTRGRINQTPTYHTNSGFSADSLFLVFASVREGATWIVRAEAATGELKALWRAPGVGDRNYIHRGMALDFDDVDGRGVCGNRVCIAPRRGLAVFTCERSVIAVDIETCQSRVLLEEKGVGSLFPERPSGCFAEKTPDPFFSSAPRAFRRTSPTSRSPSARRIRRSSPASRPRGATATTATIACG